MGLAEYISSGVKLTRENITVQTNNSGTGSVDLGSAYILLGITTTAPCRIRLYDNQTSMLNTGEQTRSFSDTRVSASVALVGDFSMSAAGTYTVDPVVYGVVSTSPSKTTHFKVDNTASGVNPAITINRYLLENSSVRTDNRITLTPIQATLSTGQFVSGTLNTNIPRTYLLVSASLSNTNHLARLRIYSNTSALSNPTEASRSFATESVEKSLIVDAVMSGSQITYFTPKIIGANLQYAQSNLLTIATNRSLIEGEPAMYYILQNAASTGGPDNISVSLHLFSLET